MKEARALALGRVAIGALFLARTTALANVLPSPLAHVAGPLLGWPDGRFVFAVGAVFPAVLTAALAVVRTVAGVAFTVGVAPRAAGLTAAAAAFAVQSQDPFGAYYTLLVLYTAVGLFALTDSATSLALRPARSPTPTPPPTPPHAGAGTGAWLIRAFVASVYVWSGIAKLHRGWLDGGVLLALAEDRHLHGPIALALVAHPALRHAAAWGVPALELVLGPLVFAPRTRRLGIGAAIALHVALEIVARPDVIGWAMVVLLLVCAAEDARPMRGAALPGAPPPSDPVPPPREAAS